MSFPRYPEYKETGIEWLGQIPAHWDVRALKRLVAMQSGEAITSETIHEVAEYPVYGGNGRRGFTSQFTHDGTFVLVGRQGALCGNINYASGKFWASEHAMVCTPRTTLEPRWFGELLRAMNLGQYSVAAAQPGLSVDLISRLSVPVPSSTEQQTIATFLDHETAKIDALVAEQEQLIALLKEKRQAVISHAVTKGLNPDAPMKDSGVEWLGQVPTHWEVLATRMISNVVRGASPRPAGDLRYFNGDVTPWVTVAEITKDDAVYLSETDTCLTEEGTEHSVLFPKGTLIYSNSGATLGVPKILQIDACANDGVVAFLNLNASVDPLFLYYFLASITGPIREKVRQGSGQPNLNTDIVKDLRLGVPPRNEQFRIAQYLERVSEQFRVLATHSEDAIELLHERRTALISAAVTGQIDVRGWADRSVA